ncbi:MAG TPA: hypothetical protein PK878_11830 [bacterium]|nr:hypothetical protein [Candidatus Omnitrophota bacterium]HOJ60967.1 hypothetical protein [bacterium]HOL94476.1 hypothetical protein [bacterium]HPO99674.1 hypothetical protein [bacterium]HXK92751.1 hypothetical protein [bacterium]
MANKPKSSPGSPDATPPPGEFRPVEVEIVEWPDETRPPLETEWSEGRRPAGLPPRVMAMEMRMEGCGCGGCLYAGCLGLILLAAGWLLAWLL